jgi:hypothetical protein
MTLKRIRLELARDQDFPDGSRERGYDLIAPIGEDDCLVADEWRLNRDRCRVRRFWAGEEERGRLVHKRGGTWAIDYDPKTEDDDEPGSGSTSIALLPASMSRSKSMTVTCARSASCRLLTSTEVAPRGPTLRKPRGRRGSAAR